MAKVSLSSAALEARLTAFEAAHQQLFSLVTDPQGKRFFQEKTAATRRREMEAQLRRTAAFLEYAGHPERQFDSVHIAGTSGKGSVTLMVAALLRELGWRTGHHTSPYLQTPLEKLVCDGRWIRPSAFTKLVEDFWALYEAWGKSSGAFDRLRYGEAWVALTFLFMAQQQVAWGIIETGMGGRFDPTNLLPAALAIVTNVGWDHERSLGPALTDIAWHKAGIIKPGQEVVTAVREPELLAVVQAEAEAQKARLFTLGKQFNYAIQKEKMVIQAPFQTYKGVTLAHGGGYQAQNAAVAIAAVDVLAHRYGKQLSSGLINQAFEQMALPGRMEVMQERPLVILDGAHNPPKMAALIETLNQRYPGRKMTAVIGAIVNKDVRQMLRVLLPAVARVIVTRPFVPGKPAQEPQILQETIGQLSDVPVDTAATVREALEIALERAAAEELILTTGSLYLVGEARSYWYPTEKLLRDSELGVNTPY